MTAFDITRKSRPVVVDDYQERWPSEFAALGRRVRGIVGADALRVDHIGSTSVPGIGAKDVIDVQITVADLGRASSVTSPLAAAGFRPKPEIEWDEYHYLASDDPGLRKLYVREPEGERRAHLHVREAGRFNQRYALLFRDFLRASDRVRSEYELAKRRAAELFPDSIDGYLFLKDPVFHIIYEAADMWAAATNWAPDDEYL